MSDPIAGTSAGPVADLAAAPRVLGLYAGQTEELERALDKDWGLAALFHDGVS